ncbi:MAG: hypothetical protein M5U07_15630 [Xanthobacteraceae bacterium]|nr:hypothetical protein [Xanthobacteraceae bacterium]
MIILPDHAIARVLPPLAECDWRTPSQARPKDAAGNENRTRFRLTARLHDGHIAWRGWFDDRDDADAFLWALATGSLRHERALWRLSMPAWHSDLGQELAYEFATVSFLTSPTGSNQTWNVPSDWNSANNHVETIGGVWRRRSRQYDSGRRLGRRRGRVFEADEHIADQRRDCDLPDRRRRSGRDDGQHGWRCRRR